MAAEYAAYLAAQAEAMASAKQRPGTGAQSYCMDLAGTLHVNGSWKDLRQNAKNKPAVLGRPRDGAGASLRIRPCDLHQYGGPKWSGSPHGFPGGRRAHQLLESRDDIPSMGVPLAHDGTSQLLHNSILLGRDRQKS